MVTLKTLPNRLRPTAPIRLYTLREALELAGITTPTYYRWVRAGKIADERIRGEHGRTFLSAPAILRLREVATKVELVG
jgi:predicted site-specific integrase-resolvase